MRNLKKILNKKLVSSKEMIAYHRFPESDDITVIPSGQPSPVVTSYLPNKEFFQVEKNGENLYVLDTENIEVVQPDFQDQSSTWEKLQSGFAGAWVNTQKDIDANLGYLEEGAAKTADRIKVDLFDLGKQLKQIGLIVGVVILLVLISKIT